MPAEQPITPHRHRRVLVIDDEELFCKFIERFIAGLGYQVRTSSRVDAADFSDLTASDLIFIDMMMPGADGIQVLDVLSRHNVKSSLVLMSGVHGEVLVTAEAIAKRLGLNVAAKLTKPFRSTDVRRILDGEHEAPRPAAGPVPSEINIEDVVAGLEHGEFDAYLQPITNLVTGQVDRYEALARWRSEKFDLVTPHRFIAVAARHGILPLLTNRILDRALCYAVRLKDQGFAWKVSVNVGVEDLLDDQLPEKIAEKVARHNLPAESLTLELTEASATANELMMLGVLARLRLKGIDLAIDDFGTSYSGLDRLSTIPFTVLKIDMRFISDMVTSKNARTIVKSSIALAKKLGMITVAEGIETETQHMLLKEMGCDLGQGNLIARPMDFESLFAWSHARSKSPRSTVSL
jgi:EAL domain-containing protein (putative c-di-GMP-specific phosphodiesterase class I)/CheY-like chemotaxis protein